MRQLNYDDSEIYETSSSRMISLEKTNIQKNFAKAYYHRGRKAKNQDN